MRRKSSKSHVTCDEKHDVAHGNYNVEWWQYCKKCTIHHMNINKTSVFNVFAPFISFIYLKYNAFSSQSFSRYTLHSKPSQKIQCILFLRKIMRFFCMHIKLWVCILLRGKVCVCYNVDLCFFDLFRQTEAQNIVKGRRMRTILNCINVCRSKNVPFI